MFEDFGETVARTRFAAAQGWLRGDDLGRPSLPIRYSGAPIRMRVSGHPSATSSVVREVFKPAFHVLETMSEGKVLVEDHWGASLHPEREGAKALRSGLTDLAPCYSGWDSAAYPMAQALRLPGLFESAEAGTAIAQRLYPEFFRPDVEKQGILMARMKATSAFHLFSTHPIRDVDDLQDLRVGSNDGMEADVLRALGAIPIVLSSLEKKAAFETGELDAIHLSDGPAEVFGIASLASYRTELGLVRNNTEFGMRLEFWHDLPSDLKSVLRAWLRAEAQAEAQVFYGVQGARARDGFRSTGMEFIRFSDDDYVAIRARTARVREEFVLREDSAGRPASALLQAIRSLTAQYSGMSADDHMRKAVFEAG